MITELGSVTEMTLGLPTTYFEADGVNPGPQPL